MNKKEVSVPSPCIRNCCLNEEDICLGCFRTLIEITGWGQADDGMRKEVLLKGEQRRKNHK